MSEESRLSKLASRRFIITILVILVSTALKGTELLEPSNFETITIWISGIYIIGKPFGDLVGIFLAKNK